MLGIDENQVDDPANFMGHHKQDIYRIPVPFRDVTDVSQLLLAAMGVDEDDDDNLCDTNSESSEPINITLIETPQEGHSNSSDIDWDDNKIILKPLKRRSRK